jgi:hypothetical protein
VRGGGGGIGEQAETNVAEHGVLLNTTLSPCPDRLRKKRAATARKYAREKGAAGNSDNLGG